MRANLLYALALVLLASPAQAEATKVSEPSDLALFALGVIGLIIGRRAARRKP